MVHQSHRLGVFQQPEYQDYTCLEKCSRNILGHDSHLNTFTGLLLPLFFSCTPTISIGVTLGIYCYRTNYPKCSGGKQYICIILQNLWIRYLGTALLNVSDTGCLTRLQSNCWLELPLFQSQIPSPSKKFAPQQADLVLRSTLVLEGYWSRGFVPNWLLIGGLHQFIVKKASTQSSAQHGNWLAFS